MSFPVTIGVAVHQEHASYDQIRRAVSTFEGMGVDRIYNWDHFFPLFGDSEGKHFEAMTMVAAWAEQTTRAQLGTLVLCNSYRNPNLLADMARTIDHISHGRFILGIGSGWFQKDYDEYGYEFGTVASRLDSLAHNLPIILDRFTKLNPQPVHKIPVMIGGGGEKKTLPLVARYADIWHYFVDEESYKHKTALLARYAREIGRDPYEIEHSAGLTQGDEVAEGVSVVEKAKKLRDLGVTHFTIGVDGPDFPTDALEKLLAWRDSANQV